MWVGVRGTALHRDLEGIHEEVAFNQRPQVRRRQGSVHVVWQRESQKAPRMW